MLGEVGEQLVTEPEPSVGIGGIGLAALLEGVHRRQEALMLLGNEGQQVPAGEGERSLLLIRRTRCQSGRA